MFYTIYALASCYPAGIFTGSLGAFVSVKTFPDVTFDKNMLSNLGHQLVDELMAEFRHRCHAPAPDSVPKIEKLGHFFSALAEEYDVAVVTTNYDNLIYRSLPGIETGFDPADGLFSQGRIIDRPSWPCLLHLHGSVHFDMNLTAKGLHDIVWQDDMNKHSHQNSFGRDSVQTTEGNQFPTSSIIVGYGKTEQIQRAPFRTYYSELDRLVHESDAVLFLGFSLIDSHVRQAFTDYRDGRNRPVVFIDCAKDGDMLAGGAPDLVNIYCKDGRRRGQYPTGPARAMCVFGVDRHSLPDTVDALKAAKDFERFDEPGRRLSIWYNGMLDACENADKIVNELTKGT